MLSPNSIYLEKGDRVTEGYRGSKLDAVQFSREFSSKYAIWHRKRCTLRLNSLENLSANRLDSCHPSVTLVTLQIGCKRPIYRHSVTLSPLKKKIPIYITISFLSETNCLRSTFGRFARKELTVILSTNFLFLETNCLRSTFGRFARKELALIFSTNFLNFIRCD